MQLSRCQGFLLSQAIRAHAIWLLVFFELSQMDKNLHDVPHFPDSLGIEPSSVAVSQNVETFQVTKCVLDLDSVEGMNIVVS